MPPKALSEAMRILDAATARGLVVRVIGGIAVLHHCPSANGGPLARTVVPDVDLVGLKKESAAIKDVLRRSGYLPNEQFNAVHGYQRLMFHAPDGGLKVDVFLDRFVMCHRLDLRDRLRLAHVTVTLADLLFTKLQIVQMNEKDLRDATAIFLDHDVGTRDEEETVNGAYLARLSGADWGVYTTLTDSLQKIREFLPSLSLDTTSAAAVRERLDKLRGMMDAERKGTAWRLRALVGRRVTWYDLPEEPKTIPLGTDRG
jgi:hypothetical protein